MKELAALKEKIPVLKEFLVGKNTAPRTHGYQYGEIAVFDKKEDLMAYEKNPELDNLLLDDFFKNAIHEAQSSWRKVCKLNFFRFEM